MTRNYTLSYQIIALMFFNDTGLMAPGKSVSPVMMDDRYQNGTRETASQAALRLGGANNLVGSRLKWGWSLEEAFTLPLKRL